MLLRALICFFLFSEFFAFAKLSIISPHRKSIQNEFVPLFQKYYKEKYGEEIEVDWIDQGGTENDLRFIINRFSQNSKTSGIDLFWGGGEVTFYDLEKRGLLEPYKLPEKIDKSLPKVFSNLSFRSEKEVWYATALSSFGIFYNKRVLSLLKMPTPYTWKDLGKKEYYEYVSLSDPRQSSSSLMMFLIMLESLGWEEGWALLNKMAGNTRKFTHSSSDPIKAVLTGDAAMAAAINFYATPQVASIGSKNLGFVLPEKATIFNSDPIGILRGAPSRKEAERFVDFVLSPEAQNLLIYPQGHEKGPKKSTLGRIAVIPEVYAGKSAILLDLLNPFKDQGVEMNLNIDRIVEEKNIIGELVGAVHVDLHSEIQAAWKTLIDHPDLEKEKLFVKPLVTKKEMEIYRNNWGNPVFRTKTTQEWIMRAKKRYEEVSKVNSIPCKGKDCLASSTFF